MQVCASQLKSGKDHDSQELEMGHVDVEGHTLDGCEGRRSVSNCRQRKRGALFAVSVVSKRPDKMFWIVVAMPSSHALERTTMAVTESPPSLNKNQPQGSVKRAELEVSTGAFYESCCGFSCLLPLDGS